jgi:hypothetical protein
VSCSACGARNPEAAAWCTQCFVTLGATTGPGTGPDAPGPADVASTGTDAPVVDVPDAEVPDVDAAGAAGAATASVRSGDVRVTGELVEWRCRRCGGWHALELAQCPACGAPREGFATGTPTTAPRVPVGTARLASIPLPGLGHVLLGAVGSGVARMVLFVLWVGGGLALVGDAPAGGAVLVLGALVLWVATLIDVERVPAGRRELLGARGLGALVVGVTVLLVLGIGLRVAGG